MGSVGGQFGESALECEAESAQVRCVGRRSHEAIAQNCFENGRGECYIRDTESGRYIQNEQATRRKHHTISRQIRVK